MIQRVQSIYLLIAAVLTGLMFALPQPFMQTVSLILKLLVWAGWGLSVIFSLFALFQFKNRSKQVKSCLLSILAIALSYAGIIIHSLDSETITEEATAYNPFIAFPLIALVLLILAIVAIRKDEKLVRSADRIR